jgi:hypothetical protein
MAWQGATPLQSQNVTASWLLNRATTKVALRFAAFNAIATQRSWVFGAEPARWGSPGPTGPGDYRAGERHEGGRCAACVSYSRVPVPQPALYSQRRPSLPVAGSRARRCIASTKGTSSWYHLLALLRSEYSIVSVLGTRGPPSGRWTARIRPTGGSRLMLIELPLD